MKKLFFVQAFLMLSCMSFAKGPTQKLKLHIRAFCCEQTTEKSADEVYFLIYARKKGSNHAELIRWPSNHIDMNDGNQPDDNLYGDSHCIRNRGMYNFQLEDGESYDFLVFVCEEDGGTSKDYQDLAQFILSQNSDPYSIAGSAILKAMKRFNINLQDTDDWMGVFGLTTSCDGGVETTWYAKDGIIENQPDESEVGNRNRRKFRMNHDGSNYVGWFVVADQ